MQQMDEQPRDDTHTRVMIGKQFYKHAARTLALALAAFGIVGGLATYILWYEPTLIDPAFAVITFLAWGSVAAGAVIGLRKPPF